MIVGVVVGGGRVVVDGGIMVVEGSEVMEMDGRGRMGEILVLVVEGVVVF